MPEQLDDPSELHNSTYAYTESDYESAAVAGAVESQHHIRGDRETEYRRDHLTAGPRDRAGLHPHLPQQITEGGDYDARRRYNTSARQPPSWYECPRDSNCVPPATTIPLCGNHKTRTACTPV